MTKSTFLSYENENMRKIPLNYTDATSDKAVIALHGSSSCKESSTLVTLAERLYPDCALFCFDLPGHGMSNDKFSLSVENAILDIAKVEEFARSLGYCNIGYFGSSLGAYLALVYAYEYKKKDSKLFLRSAAVSMGDLMAQETTEEQKEELKENNYYVLDEGFAPPLMITNEFLLQLKKYDLFKMAKKDYLNIQMVHASDDEVAPLEDAKDFANISNAKIFIINGGGHRISGDGREELVFDMAKKFF